MSDLEQQQEQKEKKPSAFEHLMVLYKDWNIDYVKTTDGRLAGYIDGELYFVGEKGGLWNWLTRQFFDAFGFAPPTSALAQVLNYRAAKAEMSKKTVKVFTRIGHGCRSHIDVGTLRHAAPGCPVICVSRLTGHRHSGIRVFSYAPHTPEGSPHASIAEPCLLVQ